MLQPHAIVVVDALALMAVHALYLEIDLFIDAVAVHSVHHRQQFSGEAELSLLYSQVVADDSAGNSDGVPAFQLMSVLLLGSLVFLVQLPIRSKVIHSVSRDRHHSSPTEEDIMRVQTK